MLIFYGGTKGHPNVRPDSPVDCTTAEELNVFRSLDVQSGFIGIVLKRPFVLQMMLMKAGIQIELLDTSLPAADFCTGADKTFAEELIVAAGEGKDVFQLARQKIVVWDYLDMR